MERKLTSFMMWSHFIVIYEVLCAIFWSNYILAFFGTSTATLSLLYHKSHEKNWQPYEMISAYSSMIYMNYQSWIKFNHFQFMIVLALNFCTFILHQYAKRYDRSHYEKWHPWLHFFPGILAHYYQRQNRYLALK